MGPPQVGLGKLKAPEDLDISARKGGNFYIFPPQLMFFPLFCLLEDKEPPSDLKHDPRHRLDNVHAAGNHVLHLEMRNIF